MTLRPVSLDDKYDLTQQHVLVTGYHALIRACLMQKERDRRAGLNTAGFVTGYRGSPLGGLDQQFVRAARQIAAADIKFQPGLNEELAATALWGTQQAELRGEGKFDGVFGMWYGKGPGVDRSGDVFRHANMAGTSKHGGVLALMGDDHTAESSTTAHQSEFHFVDVMMPILNPAGVQEIIDYALYGWAMSRYTSTWTALKCMHETVESTGVVDGRVERIELVMPTDFVMPEGGLNIRLGDTILGQEARLHDFKRDAMLAFVRANKINKIITTGGRAPKIGIITTGKAYLDVRQAFDELGIDEVKCNDLGIRLFKIGCVWPIGRQELMDFAAGLDLIIVVEEKRSLIEVQVREELYGTANQPLCIGKKDEHGNWLFPVKGALDPNDVAICIGDRILRYGGPNDEIAAHVARLKGAQRALAETSDVAVRIPYFCSGCPHNTSTRVPEGSRAYAGIGCHFMSQWMDRKTLGFTQMGGEGANWIGEAPFSKTPHVFQNLGDGTYNHSGYLAIRAAIASGVNMTYKILYNDAVAMTGGQPVDGPISVPRIAQQMAAEGVQRIALVAEDPARWADRGALPADSGGLRLTVHHRDDMDAVQRELREFQGVSVLIYDQVCAAEKRRRRKKGEFPPAARRVFINDAVCEGCGDCGEQSNCTALLPQPTDYGLKRRVDQSACNADESCIKGFCPSFVTVEGVTPRRHAPVAAKSQAMADLPEPAQLELEGMHNILITGIGGTGVITIGALIGMAAHLEGKGVSVLDMTGMSQKNGSVTSHVRIARDATLLRAQRIPTGEADLILGCDMLTAGAPDAIARMRPGRTYALVNTFEQPTGHFAQQPDWVFPAEQVRSLIEESVEGQADFLDATQLATRLMGDAIAANLFLLGFAFQKGHVPLSAAALDKAIEINGVAVKANQAAFRWGRQAALDLSAVLREASPRQTITVQRKPTLDAMVSDRIAFLTAYHDAAYAHRYAQLVERVRAVEGRDRGTLLLTQAVAANLFKLMAYKDEYEVARLYTNGRFRDTLAQQFEGKPVLRFHLAPPILGRRDAEGRPVKTSFGPWMEHALRMLARFRRLRGTPFDPFGRSWERRMERQLIEDYRRSIEDLVERWSDIDFDAALALARLPEQIRGYGHVKQESMVAARVRWQALEQQLASRRPVAMAA